MALFRQGELLGALDDGHEAGDHAAVGAGVARRVAGVVAFGVVVVDGGVLLPDKVVVVHGSLSQDRIGRGGEGAATGCVIFVRLFPGVAKAILLKAAV